MGMVFESMFDSATNFNSDLSEWNTEKSTNFKQTFQKSVNFNSNISKWNVRRVTTFDSMFNGASKFNLNLCHWNMHNALNSNNEFLETGCEYPFDAIANNACYEC